MIALRARGGLCVLSERSGNKGRKDIVHFVSDLAPHCPYVRRSGYRNTVYVHPVLVCVDRVEVPSRVGSGRHCYVHGTLSALEQLG